jgi:tRNA uridine 5-carbamoylmethylation protein Kti12
VLLSPQNERSYVGKQIIVISGAPGVGKTETIKRLSAIHKKTVHVSVDKIRSFVKAGYCSPDNWSPETEKQYKIALTAAANLSKMHSGNGFMVFVDDVFREEWKKEFERIVNNKRVIYIYLRESLKNILERNSKRSHVVDPRIVRGTYSTLEKGNTSINGWKVINNKNINATVKEINNIIGRTGSK